VTAWDIAAGLLAAGLLVYLVAVLLRPEDFS
jgi:K+-transporting ATPase KdpF subunit